MATYSYRCNYITSLTLPDGHTVIDHESKAEILWQSFKERLGTTEFTEILYDLQTLLHEVDMPGLDIPLQSRKSMQSSRIYH